MNIDFEQRHVRIIQEPHSFEPLEGKDVGLVLESVCDILEELEIKYWLSDGTLLGLHRDGDFIPHDSDIDVDVYFSSAKEASTAVAKLSAEIYDLRHGGGPKMDIVRTMMMDSSVMQVVFLDRIQNIIFDIHVYYPNRWNDEDDDKMYTYSEHGALWYPKNMFKKLQTLEHDGYRYSVPKPKDYCKLRYGSDWETPKSQKDDWENEATNLIVRPVLPQMTIQQPPHPDVHKSSINTFLKEYENVHEGRTGILFATGLSLKDYEPVPEHSDAVKVGVNRVYNSQEVASQLDYYFFGSEYELDKEYQEAVSQLCTQNSDMIKFASVFRHGSFITEGNVSLPNAAALGAHPFESNHFILSKDISKYSFIGFSIAFPALQFMLYSGMKKIYLVGCDLVNTSEHFDGNYSRLTGELEYSNEARIWKGIWDRIAIFIKEHFPEVEIISVNPMGLKGVFGELKL